MVYFLPLMLIGCYFTLLLLSLLLARPQVYHVHYSIPSMYGDSRFIFKLYAKSRWLAWWKFTRSVSSDHCLIHFITN